MEKMDIEDELLEELKKIERDIGQIIQKLEKYLKGLE
jgi:hypothetical protein